MYTCVKWNPLFKQGLNIHSYSLLVFQQCSNHSSLYPRTETSTDSKKTLWAALARRPMTSPAFISLPSCIQNTPHGKHPEVKPSALMPGPAGASCWSHESDETSARPGLFFCFFGWHEILWICVYKHIFEESQGTIKKVRFSKTMQIQKWMAEQGNTTL